jgi:hypothetical protein
MLDVGSSKPEAKKILRKGDLCHIRSVLDIFIQDNTGAIAYLYIAILKGFYKLKYMNLAMPTANLYLPKAVLFAL